MRIDAAGVHFRELNERIHQSVDAGDTDIVLDNVNGQRYIGTGLGAGVNIAVNGVPGNDLGAFMDGARVEVDSNCQDGTANTMNRGNVIVHGSAGDIAGHSMRGGRVLVRGNVGYRVGLHMKSYRESCPVLIAGGTAGDFLGEYMAGGILIVLGLDRDQNEPIVGNYCGTGMHGGTIYLGGPVEDYQLGKEVEQQPVSPGDREVLSGHLAEFAAAFRLDAKDILAGDFVKLAPHSSRPYRRTYAY